MKDETMATSHKQHGGMKDNHGHSILLGSIFGLLASPLVGGVALCMAMRAMSKMNAGTMKRVGGWRVTVGCFLAILAIGVGIVDITRTCGREPESDLITVIVAKCVIGGLVTAVK
jgi:hypothetical protein